MKKRRLKRQMFLPGKKAFALGITIFLFAILLIPLTLLAQNKTITGTVIDQNGTRVLNATVTAKNTQLATQTGNDGTFSLTMPSRVNTIVVTYVGATPVEVSVAGRNEVTVAVNITGSQMGEVVVIGYGTARKANLTTAQTSIGQKEIKRTVNTTVEQAIQGRAAGVYITQNSGQPGGGISVNIRGVSTINGNTEPLYVIDGIQMQGSQVSYGSTSSANPLAALNPNDIEDIQILQGPSATAIYGSRATNGVIMITTKRGKTGEVKINYDFQYNVQTPPRRLDVMDLRQYATMVRDFKTLTGGEIQEEFLDPSLLGRGTDWQRELFRNAPMSKHQLSASGGTGGTTYYLSGEYLTQDGIAVGSGFDRKSVRLNLDNKPNKIINLGANISISQTDEKLTTTQENIISSALRLAPNVPVKNLDGSWGGATDEDNGAQFAPVNPVAIASMTTNTNRKRQFLGGLNLGVNILKGLQFRSSFNTSIDYSNARTFIPKYKIGWAENVDAIYRDQNNQGSWWGFNQTLEYTFNPGEQHHFQVMATHEAQASTYKGVGAARRGYLTNDIHDINAGDALTAENSGYSGKWAQESYLGRLTYNYGDRYLMAATIRADGSVNFGPDKRWGYFPSGSVAWRISKEPFFNVPAISELKLRFEAGLTGNQGNALTYYAPMQSVPTPTGTGFLPGRFANSKTQWEETMTKNFGINIGLLKNRIELEADYYLRTTDNLLMDIPLPWYMGTIGQGGIQPPIVNLGKMNNDGWSFSIRSTNISKQNFTWSSNFNLSAVKTKIKEFYTGSSQVSRTSWWLNNWTQQSVVGQAPWMFRGYIEEGIFKSIEEIQNSPVPVDNNGNRLPVHETQGVWVGDAKFKDVNADGIISVEDMTFIGNPWPKLFGGFGNTFSYKGLDLSIMITGSYGNDIYNYVARVNSNPNNVWLSQNLMADVLNFARVEDVNGKVQILNPETTVPRVGFGPNRNYDRITNRWVEDGSYLRLKNITFSYNVPVGAIKGQNIIKGLRMAVGAQNVFTLTKYKGLDPEVGAYVGRDASVGNQAIGLDYGRYPLTPIVTFGLGVDF